MVGIREGGLEGSELMVGTFVGCEVVGDSVGVKVGVPVGAADVLGAVERLGASVGVSVAITPD